MAPTREPVPVRGVCRRGHETLTTAEPGKLTWRGECPTDGCPERVICRRQTTPAMEARAKAAERLAEAEAARKAAEANPPAPPAPPTGRVRKVKGYRDDNRPQPPGFGDKPEPGSSRPPAGVGEPNGSDPPNDDGPTGGPRRSGRGAQLRERLEQHRTRRAARKAKAPEYEEIGGWSAPGVYR